MRPPSPVLEGVQRLVSEKSGRSAAVTGAQPVGGGCINPTARLETDTGETFFLKWNAEAPVQMFAAEADGLTALAEGIRDTASGPSASIRVPEVFGWGGSGSSGEPGWLLMEWVPSGRATPEYGRRLGRGLGLLHAAPHALYGWERDNFIGSLPQENEPGESWATFWRDRRLAPQLRLARAGGRLAGREGRVLDTLLDRLDELLAPEEICGPGLLHGDLWSGNFYPGPSGEPVLIDPAVYRGEGEVDLAMMELFGTFPPGFLDGYQESRRLPPAYHAYRRDLYQLYYLLVHVNLFGGSYVASSVAAARRALEGA